MKQIGIIGHIERPNLCLLAELALKESFALVMINPKEYKNDYELPISVKPIIINLHSDNLARHMIINNISIIIGCTEKDIDNKSVESIASIIQKRKILDTDDGVTVLVPTVKPMELKLHEVNYDCSLRTNDLNVDKHQSQQGWKDNSSKYRKIRRY